MQPELALPLTVALAALTTWLLTPLAIRAAHATGFIDKPAGYKGHGNPTPYLGGTAIMAGVLLAGLAFGGAVDRFSVLLACVVAIFAIGTLDDRINLSPQLRLVLEVVVALILFATGNGWELNAPQVINALLTVAWVVGVVNAVNLMDNMDGAAATVVGIAMAATGSVAVLGHDYVAAAMCLAVAGACVGFLPHNLASPARIFMGDGGSMPLGLLLAGLSMSVLSKGGLGAAGMIEAALIAGLIILDTTLVTISRHRAGRPLLMGGRDHLTHRLATRFGSARAVALVLGGTQVLVCVVAVVSGQLNISAVVVAGTLAVAGALWAIRELERIPIVVPEAPASIPVLALAPGFGASSLDSAIADFFADPQSPVEAGVESESELELDPAPTITLRFPRQPLVAVTQFARQQAEPEEAAASAAGG